MQKDQERKVADIILYILRETEKRNLTRFSDSGKVYGLLYLLKMMSKDEWLSDISFKSDYYGVYSPQISSTLDILEGFGYIRKSEGTFYYLTKKGECFVKPIEEKRLRTAIDNLFQTPSIKSKKLFCTLVRSYYLARMTSGNNLTEEDVRKAIKKIGWELFDDEEEKVIKDMIRLGLLKRESDNSQKISFNSFKKWKKHYFPKSSSEKDVEEDPKKFAKQVVEPTIKELERLLYSRKQKPAGLRYINEFFRLKCSPDLMRLYLFPNAKEVSESFAAWNAYREHLREEIPLDSNTVCIVVGDGKKPRTGAVFAFMSKWQVVSIDPALDFEGKVNRLLLIKEKIENVKEIPLEFDEFDNIIIVAVHSHAGFSNTIKSLDRLIDGFREKRVRFISIPCCQPDDVYRVEDEYNIKVIDTYIDYGILSPKNNIRLYEIGGEK